jgi:hypothetical protein
MVLSRVGGLQVGGDALEANRAIWNRFAVSETGGGRQRGRKAANRSANLRCPGRVCRGKMKA